MPTIKNASGQAKAEVTRGLIQLRELSANTEALVFDIMSANSGRMKGAVSLLESVIHHDYELVIGAVLKWLLEECLLSLVLKLLNVFKSSRSSNWQGAVRIF